jgi:hypothetical protein
VPEAPLKGVLHWPQDAPLDSASDAADTFAAVWALLKRILKKIASRGPLRLWVQIISAEIDTLNRVLKDWERAHACQEALGTGDEQIKLFAIQVDSFDDAVRDAQILAAKGRRAKIEALVGGLINPQWIEEASRLESEIAETLPALRGWGAELQDQPSALRDSLNSLYAAIEAQLKQINDPDGIPARAVVESRLQESRILNEQALQKLGGRIRDLNKSLSRISTE